MQVLCLVLLAGYLQYSIPARHWVGAHGGYSAVAAAFLRVHKAASQAQSRRLVGQVHSMVDPPMSRSSEQSDS